MLYNSNVSNYIFHKKYKEKKRGEWRKMAIKGFRTYMYMQQLAHLPNHLKNDIDLYLDNN